MTMLTLGTRRRGFCLLVLFVSAEPLLCWGLFLAENRFLKLRMGAWPSGGAHLCLRVPVHTIYPKHLGS